MSLIFLHQQLDKFDHDKIKINQDEVINQLGSVVILR